MPLAADAALIDELSGPPAVRYVERNAVRANLVRRAEHWRWSSLWRRSLGTAADRKWLGKWPVAQPRLWTEHVNQVQTEAELEAIRRSVTRGQPYGNQSWVSKTAKSLVLCQALMFG